MICPNCQMNIKDDAQFCIHCGTRFDNATPTPQVQTVQQNTNVTVQKTTTASQNVTTSQPQKASLYKQGENYIPYPGPSKKLDMSLAKQNYTENDDDEKLKEFFGPRYSIVKNSKDSFVSILLANLASSLIFFPTITKNIEKLQNKEGTESSQLIQNNTIDKNKYLRAYLGSRYSDVMNAKFSWGTLLFSWVWLASHKLYGAAGQLILTQIMLSFYNGFSLFVLELVVVGLRLSLLSILIFVVTLFFLVKYLSITIKFANNYSVYYLEKANRDINTILNQTNDENERMKLCQEQGKPLYFILVIFILLPLLISFVRVAVPDLITVSSVKKETVVDTARNYSSRVNNMLSTGEVKAIDNEEIIYDKYYYVLIDNKIKDSNHPLTKSEDSKTSDKGFLLVRFDDTSISEDYICLNTNHYHISSFSGKKKILTYDLAKNNVKRIGTCNIKDISKYKATQLIKAD